MNRLTELRAFFAALAVSIVTLVFTFGFALAMRRALFPTNEASGLSARAQLTTEATQGRHLFLMNCAHCHGDDAHGDEGPDLYDLPKTDARIHQLITNGVKGEMPSFAKKLNDSDIRALTAFLRSLHT